MPVKTTTKRKSVGGERDSASAKKAKKEENKKLFENMKKEAEENKKQAAKKRQKGKTEGRRKTIDVTSSYRAPKIEKEPPQQTITSAERPTRQSLAPSPIDDVVDNATDSSSGEDEFDRLVSQSNSRRNSGRIEVPSAANEYAKVYTRCRPSSKRQNDFIQRQQELFNKSSRENHSCDDSDSGDEEEVVEKKKAVAMPRELASDAQQAMVTGRKDEMMMQIDLILFSIVSFLLGALLVVGMYFILTSLDLTNIFTFLFGTTFTDLGGHIQGMTKRVTLLVLTLCLAFGAMEIFLWFNRRANRKV